MTDQGPTPPKIDLLAEVEYELDPVPLGFGGFSVVHRAWEPGLDRWVALKVVSVEKILREMGISEEEIQERHRMEVRAAGRLRHDHIVEIYNYGKGKGILWHAMTLLLGGSVRSRIRPAGERSVNVADPDHIIYWLEILIRICRTVGFCHGQGVIHRDLKPDNILFDELNRPTITDFGLAQIEGEAHAEEIFAGGDSVYSAPELLMGQPQDDRTDVYSLGCIAHFVLTGREPFGHPDQWDAVCRNERAMLKQSIHPHVQPDEIEHYDLPQEANPALREDLARVIIRAMSGDPDKRHQQPRHLADALEEQLDIERTLRRVSVGEFSATRAVPLLTRLLRAGDKPVTESEFLTGSDDVDAEVKRTHLQELIRRGLVIEKGDGYTLVKRFDLRGGKRRREKEAIGEYLARLITSMDPPVGVSVDGGSTTNEVLRALLRQPSEIRERVGALRTNNTCWLWDLMGRSLPPGWRLLGGWVRAASLATMGQHVIDEFRQFSPAVAIIGVHGLVGDPGGAGTLTFSTDTYEEVELKRTVLQSAHHVSAIVFDSSKFGIGAGDTVMTLKELIDLAKRDRGRRRFLLVTTHPSVHSHTGAEARSHVDADRRKFVADLRDVLQCAIQTHGDRDVRLMFTPICLAGLPAEPAVTLPREGEKVDNLPFVFAKSLAEMTAAKRGEVVITIEL